MAIEELIALLKVYTVDISSAYRMSQFVGGNLCWRFLRKFTFGGFYFGDFLHLQELGIARVNNQLLLADFILAIYLSTANPPTLIPRQQIDSYGNLLLYTFTVPHLMSAHKTFIV